MVTQNWYADDGNAVGTLETLVTLHQKLQKHGPAFGYKLTKCNIIVEESFLENLARFHNRLRSSVQPLQRKSHCWIPAPIRRACHPRPKIAQNVNHAFTQGIQNKLSFFSGTTPDLEPFLQKTEKTVSEKLLHALIEKTAHTEEHRLLFSLPLNNDSLNILSPDECTGDYSRSVALSECLNAMEPIAAEN